MVGYIGDNPAVCCVFVVLWLLLTTFWLSACRLGWLSVRVDYLFVSHFIVSLGVVFLLCSGFPLTTFWVFGWRLGWLSVRSGRISFCFTFYCVLGLGVVFLLCSGFPLTTFLVFAVDGWADFLLGQVDFLFVFTFYCIFGMFVDPSAPRRLLHVSWVFFLFEWRLFLVVRAWWQPGCLLYFCCVLAYCSRRFGCRSNGRALSV